MQETYTGRKAIRLNGRDHFAEITVRASVCEAPSKVTLSSDVLEYLGTVFGSDFERHRHNVRAAVAAQIESANAAGRMPHVEAASFHAEVVRVDVSGDAGQETSGFLLTIAGMDAICEYLRDWEDEVANREGAE